MRKITVFIESSANKFPTAVRRQLQPSADGWKAVLRQAGYRLLDGRAKEDGTGYYPANDGGGYVSQAVACGHAVTVEAGCAGAHATVAVR